MKKKISMKVKNAVMCGMCFQKRTNVKNDRYFGAICIECRKEAYKEVEKMLQMSHP